MRRTATQWPPRNEKATDRQGKISHLLRLILDNCDTLNDWEREFVDKMGGLINRRRGIEPATALSEKQARKLRSIIFKKHRDYKHAVPRLPAGVKFVDEVRRLLKSQPNPNELRNKLIEASEEVLYWYLDWDGADGYDGEKTLVDHKYVRPDGDRFVYELTWDSSEREYRGENPIYTSTVKVDPVSKRVDNGYSDNVQEPYPAAGRDLKHYNSDLTLKYLRA